MKTSNKIILTVGAIPVVIVVLMLLVLRVMLPGNVSSSGDEASSKKFNQSFTVTPGGTLSLETDIGSIRIVGTSDNSVSVTADIQGQKEDVSHFEITAHQQGNDVRIEGKDVGLESRPGRWFSKFKVAYTIQVPRQYSLRLSTAGGEVSVSDLEGSVSGMTSGGDVDLKGVKGDVELATSAGDINVENSAGKISMKTSGG
ncbi:MAG: hypothetical protein EHM85_20130, partial [Desulfobacteraceae bacterium]